MTKHRFDFLDVKDIDGGWSTLYDDLGFWLDELRKDKYEPLPKADERILIERAQSGDQAARDKVINSNLRFVTNLSRKYVNDKVDAWDIISAGNEGLIVALDKFDLKKNVKLITYAVNLIRGYMIGVLRENTGMILTNQAWQLLKDYTNVYDIAELKKRWPDRYTQSEEQIEKKLQDIMDATFIDSLDAINPFTEESYAEEVCIEDDETEFDDKIVNAFLDSELSERAKDVVAMSFGIGCDRMTLDEIANELDISSSAVYRIKKASLKVLEENKELQQILEEYNG